MNGNWKVGQDDNFEYFVYREIGNGKLYYHTAFTITMNRHKRLMFTNPAGASFIAAKMNEREVFYGIRE